MNSFNVKTVIIGESNTGKTALAHRFTESVFDHEYRNTIGVEFKVGEVELGGKKVRFQIWDTVGQERYRSVVQSYYRGVQAVIICFTRSNVDSFNKLKGWLDSARQLTLSNTQFLLVACKDDLTPLIDTDSIVRFCRDNNIDWVACSAKTGYNVTRIFTIVAQLCIKAKEVADREDDIIVPYERTEDDTAKTSRCLNCTIN